jgi:phosphocarrier protein HPr
MPELVVRILNRAGLHARPASRLVELANRFRCRITIVHDGRTVDAKSVLDVLTLAATQGTDLLLRAEGEDAADALRGIEELVRSHFGMEEA